MADETEQQTPKSAAPAPKTETPAPTPPATPAPVPSPPTPPAAPTPVVEDKVVMAPAAAEEPKDETPVSSTDPDPADDENVASFKIMLNSFVKENKRPGKAPEDFKASAKLTSQITQHVIRFPTVPMLNTLLAFFREHIEDVCSAREYMKGSTLLGQKDEQKVGMLYGLFADMAHRKTARINNAAVIAALEKSQIPAFYNRIIAGYQQSSD